MSGLFGSKKEKQETTSSSNPWEEMPAEVMESYLRDLGFQQQFMDEASGIAEGQAASPRGVAGITDKERAALDMARASVSTADANTSAASGRLPGELGEFADIADLSPELQGLYAMGDVDVDALTEKYRSGYTDDVVNTTLAGMDREAQRDRLRRESQAASIGGTSNTRMAVGNAVADQLTGLNKATKEAELRDKAHTFAVDAGLTRGENDRAWELEKAGYSLKEAQAIADQEASASDFALEEEKAKRSWDIDKANTDIDVAKIMEMLGGASHARNMELAGLTGTMGETERGLEQQRMNAAHSAPTDAYSWLANMYGATNPKSTTPIGNTQTNTAEVEKPSTFSKLMGTATQAAGIYTAFSDERVKSDIRLPDGGSALDKLEKLGSRSYEYKPGYGHTQKRTTGLMAQDVEGSGIEGAVLVDDDGIRHVDIYPVLATVVDAVKELKHYRDPGKGLEAT